MGLLISRGPEGVNRVLRIESPEEQHQAPFLAAGRLLAGGQAKLKRLAGVTARRPRPPSRPIPAGRAHPPAAAAPDLPPRRLPALLPSAGSLSTARPASVSLLLRRDRCTAARLARLGRLAALGAAWGQGVAEKDDLGLLFQYDCNATDS